MNQSINLSSSEESFEFNDRYELIDGPGHAWLKVPIQEIVQLALEEKISTYSYMDTQFVYLEEDLDLSVFIRARAGLPECSQCSAEDDAKAREFCNRSVYVNYHEQPFVRRLPYYNASKLNVQ